MSVLVKKFKIRLRNTKADDIIFAFVALTFFLLPSGTAPPIISISIALLIWILSGKFLKAGFVFKQTWFYPVIPMVILPWIGLLYSQNLELGLDYALKTKYWLVVLLVATLSLDEKKVFVLIRFLWSGLFIGAFLAFLQVIGVMAPIREAFFGFGVVHTLACMYILIGILSLSFYFRKVNTWQGRLALFCLFIVFIFHLAVLRGRAGYLIFAFISPLIANNLMFKFSIKTKFFVSIILICSFLLSPVFCGVVKRTYKLLRQNKEAILSGEHVGYFPRFFIYKQSFKIIKDSPLIGIGTGSMPVYTKLKGPEFEHPHNNFLHMWISSGLLGLLSCWWLFWKMFAISNSNRNPASGFFVLSSCIVLFLGGFFDTQILNTGTLLFLTLSYGLLHHIAQGATVHNRAS